MKRKIPFCVWPFSWGLTGVDREIAKTKYYLEGEERDRKLAQLQLKGRALEEELLEINYKYGSITDFQYETSKADFLFAEGTARDLYLEDVKHKHGKTTDLEYEKNTATIRKSPWVTITKINLDETDVAYGSLELDWNDYFIEELEKKGYVAKEPEETINLWLSNLCKNIALEEFAGMGSIDDLEDDDSGRRHVTVQKDKKEDGRWEVR